MRSKNRLIRHPRHRVQPLMGMPELPTGFGNENRLDGAVRSASQYLIRAIADRFEATREEGRGERRLTDFEQIPFKCLQQQAHQYADVWHELQLKLQRSSARLQDADVSGPYVEPRQLLSCPMRLCLIKRLGQLPQQLFTAQTEAS